MEVNDKPAEVGIKLNNVLTALVLMVMSWVGMNINNMAADIAAISTAIAVTDTRVAHLEEDLKIHIANKTIHVMGHIHAD